MKSILFIIPWSGFYIGRKESNFADEPERAPEGVVGLASYLSNKGASVRIADMQQMLRYNSGDDVKTLSDLWTICQTFKPDIVGFSFFTARFKYAKDIFDYLTQCYDTEKKPLMIAGGVHPTLLPRETLSEIPFDALVIGEGEIPLLQLLKGIDYHNIKGFFTADSEKAEKADVITNLDDLPFPDWSLIDIDFYNRPSHQISNTVLHRVMPITFGRGCNYRCNFCAHNCFLFARCHSAEYFIDKMRHVECQCGVKTFIIQDSSIGNFRKVWEEVCNILIENGTPYQWWANLRVNQVDEDFLKLLKRAGCIKLFFGFESGSPRILEKMNKRITVEQCRKAAELCHKIGLNFYASFIINYFGETEEDLLLTEQLIRETRPTSLAINRFSPVPGSVDFDNNANIIMPHINSIEDWTTLGMLNFKMLMGDMTEERYKYWEKHLRSLKKYINSHESDTKQQEYQ